MLFIMPAEYGVDPTGLGTKLGLTDLEKNGPDPVLVGAVSSSEAAPKLIAGAFPSAPAEEDFDFFDPQVMGDPFSRSHLIPFRTDTIEVPLDEFEHVKIKANMKQGDALVYSWKMVEGAEMIVRGERTAKDMKLNQEADERFLDVFCAGRLEVFDTWDP
jgi:hypothetical protein